ncbi:MAG: glycosyl transferase group 1 [Chloroflexi bacterium]|nr:glycosyl transferase group 1 [Chloroflexota bacterium]
MRIAINANLVSFSGTYRQAGVSKYTELLINYLGRVDPANQYLIYFGNGPRPDDFAAAPNFRLIRSRFNTEKPVTRIAWEQFIAPFRLLRDKPALLHCPVNVMPLLALAPTVITIHDLGFIRFPERYKKLKRFYLHALTALSARRATHLITPSEAIRQEVIELLKISPERVTVIAEGVSEDFQPLPAEAVEKFRQEKGLPAKFVLYVGTLEPRKNLPLLIRAFARWRKEHPAEAAGVRLVLGGAKGWFYEEIFRLVEELGLRNWTDFPGYLREEELPLWYNSARCFVYPSIYEGFGLPPLEAMACGCPVITSNTSSLPEVVGEAGWLVSPDDETGLTTALNQLLTDDSTWTSYREKGLLQAAKFTWQEAARQTLRIYRQIVG